MEPTSRIWKGSLRGVIQAILLGSVVVGMVPTSYGEDREAEKKPAAPQGPPPDVVVMTVEPKTVPIYQEYVGQTEAASVVELRARVEGVLQDLSFEEGKPVKKDQILYRIDPREYKANLAMANATLEKAKATLQLAEEQVTVRSAEAALVAAKATDVKEKRDADRYAFLVKQDAAAQADLDVEAAQAEVSTAEVQVKEAALTNARITEKVGIDTAKAAVESAQAAVTKAELDLEYCTIKSPIDGLIGRTLVDSGNLVGRGESTLLNTVSSVDPMWVSFAVSEADYLDLMKRRPSREGTTATLEMGLILADESVFPEKGKFLMADRAVDVQTGTLNLVASFPNPTAVLRPGQFGRVRAVREIMKDALLVPQRAVMEQQSAKVVYVVGPDNTVSPSTVTVGPRYEQMCVITRGLQAGDRVIVDGIQKARPGATVNPTAAESSPPGAKTTDNAQEKPTAKEGGK